MIVNQWSWLRNGSAAVQWWCLTLSRFTEILDFWIPYKIIRDSIRHGKPQQPMIELVEQKTSIYFPMSTCWSWNAKLHIQTKRTSRNFLILPDYTLKAHNHFFKQILFTHTLWQLIWFHIVMTICLSHTSSKVAMTPSTLEPWVKCHHFWSGPHRVRPDFIPIENSWIVIFKTLLAAIRINCSEILGKYGTTSRYL